MARNAVDRLAAQIGELIGHEVELERPADPKHGDYATNVALRSPRGRPPREVAEELAEQVLALPEVERAEVAGPGFVNLWLADTFFAAAAAEIGEDYGGGLAERRERKADPGRGTRRAGATHRDGRSQAESLTYGRGSGRIGPDRAESGWTA